MDYLDIKTLHRIVLAGLLTVNLQANALAEGDTTSGYAIQPGDTLRVSVWKEEDLTQDILVRPDGGFSFPLAGEISAAGRATTDIQRDLVEKIEKYIPEPVVTVQVMQIQGHKFYVLGKVNRPGEFVMARSLDVTQALAVAGGLATFADEKKISILRRESNSQRAIPFNYAEVQYGRELEQNVLLRPGDVILVP